jgi:hypothetical protein
MKNHVWKAIKGARDKQKLWKCQGCGFEYGMSYSKPDADARVWISKIALDYGGIIPSMLIMRDTVGPPYYKNAMTCEDYMVFQTHGS